MAARITTASQRNPVAAPIQTSSRTALGAAHHPAAIRVPRVAGAGDGFDEFNPADHVLPSELGGAGHGGGRRPKALGRRCERSRSMIPGSSPVGVGVTVSPYRGVTPMTPTRTERERGHDTN